MSLWKSVRSVLGRTEQRDDLSGESDTESESTTSAKTEIVIEAAAGDNSSTTESYTSPDSKVQVEAEADKPSPFPALNSSQRASPASAVQQQPSQPSLKPPISNMAPPNSRTIPDRSQSAITSGRVIQERPLPTFNFSNASRRTPATATPSSRHLAPPDATNSQSLASAQRRRAKVALDPGFSQLDWAMLKSKGIDLSGRPPGTPTLRISKDELRQHRSTEDAWTALGGKVYNITPYVRYHPGGVKELMRCAGRDGTKLFNLTHSWVNYDRMLGNCLVGYLISEQ
ncbi:uncharacterized protein V1516DRAFT_669565 [Lipomyces oligophaga]|uniref:uncharacterized protein n=1 Tax=Lipomyces oligophaga TaxID=45792 RepID=UPI0034CF5350